LSTVVKSIIFILFFPKLVSFINDSSKPLSGYLPSLLEMLKWRLVLISFFNLRLSIAFLTSSTASTNMFSNSYF
jgi:hypothetical protein